VAGAALVVAVIAVLISFGSLSFARRADARAERAEQRQEAEAAARRQGRPLVTLRGTTRPVDGPRAKQVVYEYEVRNVGYEAITELRLWIVDSGDEPVSTGDGGPMLLMPGGDPEVVEVGLLYQQRYGLTLMVSWKDADGEHGPISTGVHPIP
jgi:hypothetical protein